MCVEYLSFKDPRRMQSWQMHSACFSFQYIIGCTCTFYFNAPREKSFLLDPSEVDSKKERIIRINERKMKLFVASSLLRSSDTNLQPVGPGSNLITRRCSSTKLSQHNRICYWFSDFQKALQCKMNLSFNPLLVSWFSNRNQKNPLEKASLTE